MKVGDTIGKQILVVVKPLTHLFRSLKERNRFAGPSHLREPDGVVSYASDEVRMVRSAVEALVHLEGPHVERQSFTGPSCD